MSGHAKKIKLTYSYYAFRVKTSQNENSTKMIDKNIFDHWYERLNKKTPQDILGQ